MKSYYLFNQGRLSRKDNTLKFVPTDANGKEGTPKYLPIEDVEKLYVFGSLDVNSAVLNFLGKHNVTLHFFDYYEHYTGSFMPKEYLLAGKMQIEQTKAYLNHARRIEIARKMLEGGSFNMLKNLRYYTNRDKDCSIQIEQIEILMKGLKDRRTEELKDSVPQSTSSSINQSVSSSVHQLFNPSAPQSLNPSDYGHRGQYPYGLL